MGGKWFPEDLEALARTLLTRDGRADLAWALKNPARVVRAKEIRYVDDDGKRLAAPVVTDGGKALTRARERADTRFRMMRDMVSDKQRKAPLGLISDGVGSMRRVRNQLTEWLSDDNDEDVAEHVQAIMSVMVDACFDESEPDSTPRDNFARVLVVEHGLEHAQAAELLGVSSNTLSKMLQRAKDRESH